MVESDGSMAAAMRPSMLALLLIGACLWLALGFSYFANVIEEVRELTMPTEYWRRLQMRVARLERQ